MRFCSAISPKPPFLFRSSCTLFTKAENVTMGTHYQATSVAWHDAQWLLGHCCQWLLGSVGQYVCVCVCRSCMYVSMSRERRKCVYIWVCVFTNMNNAHSTSKLKKCTLTIECSYSIMRAFIWIQYVFFFKYMYHFELICPGFILWVTNDGRQLLLLANIL